MTPLHLSPSQHQSLWLHLDSIREAIRDVRIVAEHHGVVGLGDLSRRLSADYVRTITAAEKVARILENAAKQTEAHV